MAFLGSHAGALSLYTPPFIIPPFGTRIPGGSLSGGLVECVCVLGEKTEERLLSQYLLLRCFICLLCAKTLGGARWGIINGGWVKMECEPPNVRHPLLFGLPTSVGFSFIDRLTSDTPGIFGRNPESNPANVSQYCTKIGMFPLTSNLVRFFDVWRGL